MKPILITGASSGIGYHLATFLAERGHLVYGTVRKKSDLAALNKIENIIPIELDVRDPEQIDRVVGFIADRGQGLYGLVNNAGIGELGLFSTWTDEELLNLFEVNVFGVHRMANACMDMLVESKGRIVNIGSQGGMITKKYFGPYTMTKHALEAFTDALHDELEPYGVHVSIVQPGGVESKISETSLPNIITRFERAKAPFTEEAKLILEQLTHPRDPDHEKQESEENRLPSSPEIVSKATYDALFSEKPKVRYLVGTKWEGDRVIHALVKKLIAENECEQLSYSRDELISILDQHLK